VSVAVESSAPMPTTSGDSASAVRMRPAKAH
jgi:hypothetical protein